MLKSRCNPLQVIAERRTSTNSDSSTEPMDISAQTVSTEPNSSLIVKTSDQNDSDNLSSDREEKDYQPNNLLRDRHFQNHMMIMRKAYDLKIASKNIHNNNNWDKQDLCGSLSDTNDNMQAASPESTSTDNRNDRRYVCPICSAILNTRHSLTEHIRGHNTMGDTQTFICPVCAKHLSSASSLDRHILVHTGERPFNCKLCTVTFTTNGNMHRHMRTHRRDGENYESESSTDSSNTSINNNYCNSRKRKIIDDDGTSLKRRLKNINNNNITKKNAARFCCPVCVRNDFATILNLENHMDREHPSIQAKCRYCEVVFKSHKALNAHRCDMSNENHVTHGFSDLTFTDFSSDKYPMIARLECEQGSRIPISIQRYECHNCNRAFPCASAVEIHNENCPQDFSIRKRKRNETSDEEAKRDDFFAHLRLQNKSAPANSSFNTTQPECNKPLSQIDVNDTKDLADIQSIINVASSGGFLKELDKSVPQYVTKRLPFPRDKEDVEDSFTAEFRKMKLRGEFPCKLCKAVFPNLRALKGHNRIHLCAAGSGPYQCNMCPFSIHDKAALVRHMRTHNGDRPYECSICNYAFTTKANCERHLRNRHGKTTRDEVKRSIIYHPSEDPSCDDPVKKMQIYNSSFDDEEVTSKDRCTPASNLKDGGKIQVKSLDQLIKPNFDEDTDRDAESFTVLPVDLSMDVLDLSRKRRKTDDEEKSKEEDEEYDEHDEEEVPKNDLSIIEKNHQMWMLQQQFLNENLTKISSAHYLQLSQLYQNIVPIYPFLHLQQAFMAQNNELKDIHPKDLPRQQVFPPGLLASQMFSPAARSAANISPIAISHAKEMQQRPSTPAQEPVNIIKNQQVSNHSPQNQQLPSNNSVKLVIKNGVVVQKQKQRRYRTDRPFVCEHCRARFTLRSNMERHIKQQHPQFWAQRQRNGHNILRRGSSSAINNPCQIVMPSAHPQQLPQRPMPNQLSAISDQVKFAILAQQLKCRNEKSSDYLMLIDSASTISQNDAVHGNAIPPQPEDDDESELVIDEDSAPEDLSAGRSAAPAAAKRAADTILEEATRLTINNEIKDFHLNIVASNKEATGRIHNDIANVPSGEDDNIISKETIGKPYHPISNGPSREEGDLVSVSKLVDNATSNAMSFGNYFRPDITVNEHSDEEGLVASGSASESNNSGTEEPNPQNPLNKKKSAYSLAPNRVTCPYCQRMFPWTSSLRRHVLTHTGQKPFKCSHCPLLFTTKSNCDRHLLRKHNNIESATSLYVPLEDVPEPRRERQIIAPIQLNIPVLKSAEQTIPSSVNSSDLPFKCHLCDGSFSERLACLEHIKNLHSQEFSLLMAKGAIEAASEQQIASAEDEERNENRGKYPDYANRKVICAFCMRRFWSTEDLRRHMRTHSGERPFQCPVCMRKFTLKHSMLRHQKKHTNTNPIGNGNSASDLSDDEPTSLVASSSLTRFNMIPDLIPKEWKVHTDLPRSEFQRVEGDENSELIGNLLGISDPEILNRMLLSSPDEAAKLLGVEK